MPWRLAWIAVTAIALAAVATDVPELVRGPAPYPPEWQWLRREGPTSGRLGPVLACGTALLALLLATGRAAARRRPVAAARCLLAAASVLGVGLSVSLLALEPAGAVDALYGRVVYRTATSYYTVAVSPEAADPVAFVARHHELLPGLRTAAKHAATHPPGPVLYYRAIVAAGEAWPSLSRAVLAAAGLPETNPRRPRPQHAAAARAAALLGGGLTIVLCALVVWPAAALARALGASPLGGARVGALWAVLPGPALMAPMLDQMVALPVAVAAAGLAVAATAKADAGTRRVWTAVVLAGLCGGLATLLSYGAAAFLALAGVAALALGVARGAPLRSLVVPMAAAAGLALLTFLTPALAGHRPFASARVALDIHRDFFTAPRQYGVWLVFNLVDAAVFLGPPIALAFVMRVAQASRARAARRVVGGAEAYALGAAVGLVILVLSGVTRGEVGRLWIPVMPVFLVAALAPATTDGADDPRATDVALLAALLIALDVALRVWWRIPS